MLIVGGRNSIAGSVLGVALITVVNETTRHLADTEIDGGPAEVLDVVLRARAHRHRAGRVDAGLHDLQGQGA